MCQPLSIGNFMFRNDLLDDLNLEKIKEITKNNIYNIDTKRTIKQTNFILEVDLDYPKNLHDLHNDFSFAPEHLQSRLIPNLYNKNKYILHFRNLEFYIDNGLILKKIHRVLQFTESNWMKGYIMFNTNKRMKSDNKFEKCLYKLMNNFIYGKSIGNVRKRVSFRLVNNDKKAINLCSKPNYKRYIELDKNNHIIKLSKLSSFMINQSIWECVY